MPLSAFTMSGLYGRDSGFGSAQHRFVPVAVQARSCHHTGSNPGFVPDNCRWVIALPPPDPKHTFLQAKKNPKILTFVGLSDFKYC
ncbi:hypothetical protein EMIT0373P_30569 [Pseudomonas chlororaphis]